MKLRIKTLRAFSLLEMAVVITIVSVLIALSADMFSKIQDSENRKITREKLETAVKMLAAYRRANNFLPCPAGLRIAYGASNFGSSSCIVNTGTGGGIYRINGSGVNELIKGVLPTNTLGLPQSAAIDAWGNKILYVMRRGDANTSSTGYGTTATRFTIRDSTNTNIISASDGVYAVISTGRDGNGAWDKFDTGTTLPTCSSSRDDRQNCNTSTSTGVNIATGSEYRPTEYDNIVVWRTLAGLDADANY